MPVRHCMFLGPNLNCVSFNKVNLFSFTIIHSCEYCRSA